MNVLNFYTSLYGALYNRRWLYPRMLSPLRFVVRKLANYQIPSYLSKGCSKIKGERYDGLIVSFTSFPARIDKVWMVVECLKRQTVLPEKIILWLSKEQFPLTNSIPTSLQKRTDDLFEIRMVDGDLKSHKKYYYTVQQYPDKLILLIDDDIFYPTTMIEEMMKAHSLYPDAIICRYGYQMTYSEDHRLKNYKEWKMIPSSYKGRDFFFGSGGGTLIQPQKMYKDIANKELFVQLTPTADDVWLNSMALINKVDIIKLSMGLVCPILQKGNNKTLSSENKDAGQNDVQISNVVTYYQNQKVHHPFNL